MTALCHFQHNSPVFAQGIPKAAILMKTHGSKSSAHYTNFQNRGYLYSQILFLPVHYNKPQLRDHLLFPLHLIPTRSSLTLGTGQTIHTNGVVNKSEELFHNIFPFTLDKSIHTSFSVMLVNILLMPTLSSNPGMMWCN